MSENGNTKENQALARAAAWLEPEAQYTTRGFFRNAFVPERDPFPEVFPKVAGVKQPIMSSGVSSLFGVRVACQRGKTMSPVRFLSALLVLSLSVAACGCFGRGGDGKTASRGGRFGKKEKQTASRKGRKQPAKRGQYDFAEYTPDSSLSRDVAMLKEHEAKQVQLLKQMAMALDQNREVMRKEEEKLAQIRGKIDEYELAMRSGPGSAPRGRGLPSRDGVVADSMYAGYADARPRRDVERAPQSRQGGYAPQPASYRPAGRDYARQPERREYREPAPAYRDERRYEETLYDPRAAGMPQRQPEYRQVSQNPRPPAPREQYYEAPPARQNAWEPSDSLYSNAASRPASPVKNTLRPEPRLERPAPVRVEESLPAAGASVQPRQQSLRPPAAETRQLAPAASASDEDVFTPDMYLSGGR